VAASLQAEPLATFRLQVEDLSDNPITTVNLGQDFQLAAYVEDVRDPAATFPGVWAAFMHVAYNSTLVSITAMPNVPDPNDQGNKGDLGIEFGDYFDNGLRFGDLATPGQINGIGSASLTFINSGIGDILLWRITIHTSALGTVTFSPTFDSNEDHQSSFIDPPNQLMAEDIQFIGDSVQIVPEPSSLVLAVLGTLGVMTIARRKRQRRVG
jgi:hypothetical protein